MNRKISMLGWIIRIFFVVTGFIASFFVARDALNFDIVQMVVGVILFTSFIMIVAFWPMLSSWVKKIVSKK